ncbi:MULTISPECIES: aminoglycoside phosphotransferase family protein [Candidatus Ichthyocystis]|uniref:aminoglycoside phosphotransferase family protein n=1 Tax=Candidatus Ichthyocystis TaxID=2929841 RepID=UPI000B090AB2|nr:MULTISPECIES: phosphotransferase [Ichthyocystis]
MYLIDIENDERAQEAYLWAMGVDASICSVEYSYADASFRRYFRLSTSDGRSYIVMDAPPEREKVVEFLNVAKLLDNREVRVPLVYESSISRGFILLEDLGCQSFYDVVSHSCTKEKRLLLYRQALHILRKFSGIACDNVLPVYNQDLLKKELLLFVEWYLPYISYDESVVWNDLFESVIKDVASHHNVFVHRDFHSKNMIINNQDIAVIDFQDAVVGSTYYDLVSLLRDVYVLVSKDDEFYLLRQYYLLLSYKHESFELFYRQYVFMGLQRHLKILGIFVRLFKRDGKSHYLPYLSRVLWRVSAAVSDLFGPNSKYKDALSYCFDRQTQKLRSDGVNSV